jgi:NAD(P)-dependent dehydrogenase (short-subunit alcohol dehydrogenase family)
MRFEGKVIAVTGGAGGIGAGILDYFARAGARVAALDLDLEAAWTVASALGDRDTARALRLDVADAASVQAAVDAILDDWGQIDVWVNNAGIFGVSHIAEMPDLDEWRRMLAVNLTGVFLCCQTVARPMVARRSGAIINISSIAGKIGFPEEAGYCGTKAGVLGLTRSVAVELAPHGIRVNAICPGNIRTPMLESVDARVCRAEGWEPGTFLKQTATEIPLGYIGEPKDVAAAVAFLASDDASYIVGQALTPDGGLVLY